MDFILNGEAHGDVATMLINSGFDVNILRPWIDPATGRSYRDVVHNGVRQSMIQNTPATLRKDDWIQLDDAIVKVGKERLRVVNDLTSRGLQLTIANGLGKTVLQTETQSDINEAEISMDGMRESQRDRPEFNLINLPLPIIHKDFSFSARVLAASRNGGSPLDTSTAELAARRVSERAEQLLLGLTDPGAYGYASGTIYGYTNHPNRNTRTITNPTTSGWTGATLLGEVLLMQADAHSDNHYGPYVLYAAPNWNRYLEDDYSTAKGENSLRDRLKKIEGIEDVRTVDLLTGYDMVLVQMTSDVARMVVGLPLTTLQWPSQGGMKINFKVMAILVPQIRVDFSSQSGIVHGSV